LSALSVTTSPPGSSRPPSAAAPSPNAVSEFEDPQSPVRLVVAEHRQWHYQFLRRAFEDAGHQLPANAARHFVTLRDGAMSAAYLDTPTTAIRTFARGVDRLIRAIDTFP